MQFEPAGSQPSIKGPAEYFMGTVRIDPLDARPGNGVWCPPLHEHRHGATPPPSMPRIAIQEALDGENGEWLQKATDEEYAAGPAAA